MNRKPQLDASIAVLTYCHEDYIEQALDSILSQKTSYSFEIVVSDDFSTDNTKSILLDYQANYPDKIKVFFNEKNIGITANFYKSRCLCSGRYIFALSGDDYWISDTKLEEQVSFLDTHSEFVGVTTCIEGRFDNADTAFSVYPSSKYRDKAIDLETYTHGGIFPTGGMAIRNYYITEEGKNYFSIIRDASRDVDDATECIALLLKGPIYVIDKCTYAHRVPRKTQSAYNYNSLYSTMDKVKQGVDLYNYLYGHLKCGVDYFCLYKDLVAVGFASSILQRDFEKFWGIYNSIPSTYRDRHLFIKSLPKLLNLSCAKIMRLIKSNI